MRSWYSQNLTDGRLPLWRHGRVRLFGRRLTVEWLALMRSSIGAGVGSRGFSIRLFFFAIYVSFGTSGDGMGRREIDIHWNDGCLWISHPFEREGGMEWHRDDPWWKKVIVFHVIDWIRGRAKYDHVEGDPFEVLIPMPEGCYAATATHQRASWSYRWYWPSKVRESVWLRIPGGGIPHSGKGESSWDCGDDGLCGIGGDTVEDAIANAVKSSLKSRRKYGLDSARTGERAIRIVNQKPAEGKS